MWFFEVGIFSEDKHRQHRTSRPTSFPPPGTAGAANDTDPPSPHLLLFLPFLPDIIVKLNRDYGHQEKKESMRLFLRFFNKITILMRHMNQITSEKKVGNYTGRTNNQNDVSTF
eukprot:GEMP01083996.1.p1 GENE.GEMP01083996.1~~GEMP01083996.1.p1  ORF type:complete len:114 (+),score=1.99 GEMP01083996.1:91-432(+)